MDPQRKFWNERQKELRSALSKPAELERAIQLFLSQHAMVHASEMSQSGLFSFEDGLWEGLNEANIRSIPPKEDHSLVWIIWHLARIEDMTMNVLVAGTDQVFHLGGWREKIHAPREDSGNMTDAQAVTALSAAVDIAGLRQYRLEVGRRTREIASTLTPADIKRKTSPDRLDELLRSGSVSEAARDLLDYWGGLTVAGLLLMPPTRHNFAHLNEARNMLKKD